MVQHRAFEAQNTADSGFRSRAPRRYVLRDGQLEHALDKFPLLLGRGSGADIVLTGPLVSRRHAELTDTVHGLVVTDLGSRNGVFLNGQRVLSPEVLEVGDCLAIGEHTFVLIALTESAPAPAAPTLPEPASRRNVAVSEVHAFREADRNPAGSYSNEDVSIATRRADALQLLGSVVDKALALGRGEEAEHLIGNHLVAALSDASLGRRVSPEVARAAAQYAVKLAAATGKATWLDFAFRLYFALGSTMPLPVVDEMFTVLRRVRGLDRELLHAYAEQQRGRRELSAPERFVLQRLDGLERLAAWHPAD